MDDGDHSPIEREWSQKFLNEDKTYIEGLRAKVRQLAWAQKNPQEILGALVESNFDRLDLHDLEELTAEVWMQELKKLGSN